MTQETRELVDVIKGDPLAALGLQLNTEPTELKRILKATAFKTCATDEQFMTCVMVAQAYRLNPLLKQIYAFPGRNGEIVPIVPIDGWISMVQAHSQYDGVEQIENFEDGKLVSVTTKLFRKDQARATVHTEYLRECFRDTEPWKKWPVRMLCWKSYIQTARMAFGFSGIFDEDEAQRIDEAQTAAPGKPAVSMPRAIEQAPEAAASPSQEQEPAPKPQDPAQPPAEVPPAQPEAPAPPAAQPPAAAVLTPDQKRQAIAHWFDQTMKDLGFMTQTGRDELRDLFLKTFYDGRTLATLDDVAVEQTDGSPKVVANLTDLYLVTVGKIKNSKANQAKIRDWLEQQKGLVEGR